MDNETKQEFQKLFAKFDQAFGQIDARFNAVDARFDAVDARFDGIDGQLTAIRADLRRHEVLLDENSKELKLAVRTFQTLHEDERGRLDVAREALDRRLIHVERAIGSVSLGPDK